MKHLLIAVQKEHRKKQQAAPIQLGDVKALASRGQAMISANVMMQMSDTAFKEAYKNRNFEVVGTKAAMDKLYRRAYRLDI